MNNTIFKIKDEDRFTNALIEEFECKDRWDTDFGIETLKNKTPIYIGYREDEHELYFVLSTGSIVKMHHEQNCCERVWLEDVTGDINDLVNTEILSVEEVTETGSTDECESYTYTFYTFRTQKGTVTLRWNGESNGYYSESVDFSLYQRKGTDMEVINPELAQRLSLHIVKQLEADGKKVGYKDFIDFGNLYSYIFDSVLFTEKKIYMLPTQECAKNIGALIQKAIDFSQKEQTVEIKAHVEQN